MTAKVHKLEPGAAIPGVEALTEDSLALNFVATLGDYYRYVPGWGWMIWKETRWGRDLGLRHFDDARLVARDFGDSPGNTLSETRRIASAKTVAAIVQLARSDQQIVVMPDAFDANSMELNTPAGIVNLMTGNVRSHHRDYVTKVTAVGPDFTARAPAWNRFLLDVFAGDAEAIAFMRRLLGYFVTGDVREQILAFFFGDGRNGKSTLLDVLLWLLGDYAIKCPSSLLMTQRGERHPTDIASLAGVRIAVSNEIEEGTFWDEARLKELTGDIRLTARFMRQDFFSFDASHKHVVAGNHRPQVRTVDAALKRRLMLIPFTAKFEWGQRDPEMVTKLKAEGSAILAWIIGGAREWAQSGLLAPAVIIGASEDYVVAMDALGNWISECCDTADPHCNEKSSNLYASFRDWKITRGESPVSETRWSEQLQSRGFARYRSNGSHYRGIRLTCEERYRLETGKHP